MAVGNSSGLTAGAKAGMGIGVVLGTMILAVIAFLIFYHRRKGTAKGSAEDNRINESERPAYHELAQYEPGQTIPAEMHGGGLCELQRTEIKAELEPDKASRRLPEGKVMSKQGRA